MIGVVSIVGFCGLVRFVGLRRLLCGCWIRVLAMWCFFVPLFSEFVLMPFGFCGLVCGCVVSAFSVFVLIV